MRGHVRGALAAYAEGQLPPAGVEAVERHLGGCASCRRALEALERGLAIARQLPPAALPPHRAAAIRAGVDDALGDSRGSLVPGGAGGVRAPGVAPLAAAAAAVLVVASMALHVGARGSGLTFQRSHVTTGWDALATRTHRAFSAGAAMDVASSSPAVLRDWAHERAGLGVSLADLRTGDPARIEPRGARLLEPWGYPIAAMSYRVGGRPATLLVAPDGYLADVPAWTSDRMPVSVRSVKGTGATPSSAGALEVLAWRNSGNAYALVSELPGLGEAACFVCHAGGERRRQVTEAAARDQSLPIRPLR